MKHEQITAWALNELSPQEREQIEAALRENPQIKARAEETKSFCDLLTHELRDESLEFTSEQRSRLQTMPSASNIIVPSAAPKPVRWSFASRLGSIAAAAACVAVGGYWMYPWLRPQKEQIVAQAVEEERLFRVGAPEVRQQFPNNGLMADPVNPLAKDSLPLDRNLTFNSSRLEMTRGDGVGGIQLGQDMPATPLLAANGTDQFASALKSAPPPPAMPQAVTLQAGQMTGNMTAASAPGALASGSFANAGTGGALTVSGTMVPQLAAANATPVVGSGQIQLSGGALSGLTGPANINASTLASNQPNMVNSVTAELGADTIRPAAAPASKPFEPQLDASERLLREQASSNESYTRILENELMDVRREPLSTFSIDVDTASYANVRRFLNQNMLPPADAVRLEELINYFPSDEEGPVADAKEPFAARVELAACPWQPHHRLARIAIQGKQVQKGSKASNLVFLVDVSGSMNDPQKLPLVKQSLRMLAEQMGEGDRVSMVTYASGTSVVLPPTNGENRPQIIAAVDQLHAGGSTNGAGGLRLAYEQAVGGFIQEGINRVILCTDGDFNVGISDPTELEKFIAEKARSGVFLSVLGFGSGNLKDRTMETLADKGNGNYAYIDGLAEARKVLVEQMAGTLVTIAKDVKVQIEFNPAQVRAYRLIGYENRLLAKEDFNDDTKDAGEIGSGHRVVALYELVPANLPPGVEPDRIVDTLKYQTLASPTSKDLNEVKPAATTALDAAASKELMTVKLRYKQPDGDTSSKIELPVLDEGKTLEAASAEFQFSAAVAGFGLLLRDSSYKGTLNWEAVRKLALAGKGTDKLGYRGEFLQLIDKAAGLKQTK